VFHAQQLDDRSTQVRLILPCRRESKADGWGQIALSFALLKLGTAEAVAVRVGRAHARGRDIMAREG
jgi:hypothetical protein